MEIPEPPKKFKWREVRAWLNIVRQATLTAQVIDGEDIYSSEDPGKGTTVNANECEPCP